MKRILFFCFVTAFHFDVAEGQSKKCVPNRSIRTIQNSVEFLKPKVSNNRGVRVDGRNAPRALHVYFKVLFLKNKFEFLSQYNSSVRLGFHYFQPFYGKIPPKAFKAATDTSGEVKYVARIISPDNRTWSAPTTFSATNIYAFFGWKGEAKNRVTKLIELLMVENYRPGFGWYRVNSKKDLFNLHDACCFVEGGYGYENGKKYTAYVARTFDQVYHVGALYIGDWNNRDVMHYMDGWESKYTEKNYAVLAYDCCLGCGHHYSQCCRQFKKITDEITGQFRIKKW